MYKKISLVKTTVVVLGDCLPKLDAVLLKGP